eukprot:332283-Pyramimonas_sp.AAC.1
MNGMMIGVRPTTTTARRGGGGGGRGSRRRQRREGGAIGRRRLYTFSPQYSALLPSLWNDRTLENKNTRTDFIFDCVNMSCISDS